MGKIMKYRKGVFIVIYSKTEKGIEYLILKRKLHWKGWEFPKGGLENNENSQKTILRELKEETGIKNPLIITKFDFSGKYKYEKELSDREGVIGQTFSLYGIRVKKQLIKVDSKEHSNYRWVDYNTAMSMLTWPNQKKCLKLVNSWLKSMKFREVKLDSGNIVLMGRNEAENEKLVREFLGKDNVIMHTVASGSPFCVALEKPSAKEKKEIASLCAAYSQDWRDNKQDVKVHVFTGKQVYKRPRMKIGTFGIKKAKIITAKKQDIIKWKK
jgi:8-oxo-dGTP pyrophosphatase MutT (NUDIX family)